MNVIFVSSRLAKAKTLTVTPRFLCATFFGFILLSFATSFIFSWVGIRFNLPFVSDLVAIEQQSHYRKTEKYVRDNVAAMAVKLGELQAQVVQLDSLGDRIAKITGIKPQKPAETPQDVKSGKELKGGQGGPLISLPSLSSADELQREIDRLSQFVEDRREKLTELESQLMEKRIQSSLLPTLMPIKADRISSGFGWRIDPIVGVAALHKGVDFSTDTGTPVIAAAGGVVAVAEYHPQYGNLITIDHGNEFSSRYAHLSEIDVKSGQVVRRGQRVGESGNTGRSTGPHLHFEVRFRDVPQNPMRFLQSEAPLALNDDARPEEPGVASPLTSGGRKERPKVTLNTPQ